ncbi:putative surface protein sp1 protein [Botrytis fragariae]|uniref:Putative surface protein sp1 protein n=1 Tax=Botrytis fragariae TaxID=1964551 RepID=A0A8H6EIR2_9HELO|nr:putative surface protein sp1 protein [Botrytis fragariae]KAF5873375.1 putative surface protein sp1 protein [Botrytis fragariae]
MRFSVIAVSIFAGAAMAATSTDYVTEEVTITSCAATVTDCPARSTQVSTTIYSRTSSTEAAPSSVTPAGQPSNSGPVASGPASSAPVASAPASSAPASSKPATSVLVPVASSAVSSAPVASSPAGSAPVASAPASSAPASSKPASFTPTYATPAASSAGSSLGVVVSSPAPSVSVVAITTCIPTVIYSTISLSGLETTAPGVPAASAKPSSTGYISVPANGTTPAATQTPLAFTGAAANVQVGGAAIAAVFGLAAFLL